MPDLGATTARKATIAGGIGNLLEWYDFAVYGFLASILGTLFFPSNDPTTSLLASFAAFGVGFFVRPMGALVFGHIGDRVGRRAALSVAVICMGVSTFLIGILPTYGQIGIAAPALLVAIRLVQGFSAGGEWGGSATFMVEYAPEGRRGLYGSWQQVSVFSGFLLGTGIGALLTSTLPHDALYSWGWRLPFLGGLILAIVGLYLRLRIEDTPEFRKLEEVAATEPQPVGATMRETWRPMLVSIGFILLPTAASYLYLTYMPTYMSAQLGLPLSTALQINALGFVAALVLMPFVGALSDRIGRRPILIAMAIGYGVLSYPLFSLMDSGAIWTILLGQLVLAAVLALYSGPGPATLVEMFPTRVRYTSLSFGYNISVAAFGGSAPFIATLLIKLTGNQVAPTFFIIGGAVVTLLTIVFGMKETYKSPLTDEAAARTEQV